MMDPFECFDDDDDDDDDVIDCNNDLGDNDSNSKTTSTCVVRDDLCGVLAFHAGTEAALLQYVQSKMIPPPPPPAAAAAAAKLSTTCSSHLPEQQQQLPQQQLMMSTIRQAKTLLYHVDDFCLSRHWMMHIGTEKGTSLRPFLLDCFDTYQQKQQQQNIDGNKVSRPFQMLELGTYCGYSAIFLVKTLLEECLQRQQQQAGSDKDTGMTTTTVFRLTTVDVVEQHVKIAREMIRLAGVESYIDLVLLTQEDDDGDHNESNNNHISLSSHPSVKDHYEFVFLDHDKSLYLSDLQALERTHRIRRGTYVAADNVIFAQIDEYRQYLQRLASHQVVTTRLEE
ncbi:O-methyltransferase family protein [Nitzschia inconspicua]|uniref:catechol O-methyltransferase n=1 Tax=Nitzschia inconspicua TaxID=303405 RepID=A0A9K3L8T9_9STRA|nr:O-methyltransferase family protein [Nitzschia inconspicua]